MIWYFERAQLSDTLVAHFCRSWVSNRSSAAMICCCPQDSAVFGSPFCLATSTAPWSALCSWLVGFVCFHLVYRKQPYLAWWYLTAFILMYYRRHRHRIHHSSPSSHQRHGVPSRVWPIEGLQCCWWRAGNPKSSWRALRSLGGSRAKLHTFAVTIIGCYWAIPM